VSLSDAEARALIEELEAQRNEAGTRAAKRAIENARLKEENAALTDEVERLRLETVGLRATVSTLMREEAE
jgi:hypothetical protein